jgi:hypothetical protein
MQFEVEGAQIKDLWAKIAQLQDIFEAEEECGCCGGASTRMVAREDQQGNKYYELRCLDCHATFSFGQRRQGGDLYPRRRDKDGNPLENHGWSKWEKTKTPAAAPAATSPNSQRSVRPISERPI